MKMNGKSVGLLTVVTMLAVSGCSSKTSEQAAPQADAGGSAPVTLSAFIKQEATLQAQPQV
jgi:uncharacterized protein YceK